MHKNPKENRFHFDQHIERKGTYCTQWDYVQDRFGQADLLPFTISDMDFASPDVVINDLKTRLEHPVLGYSRWDHDDFKEAIVNWYAIRFNCAIQKEHLVYGPSVIYIIAKLIEKWSQPFEGVVFQSPAYDAFEKMIKGAQRRPISSPLLKTPEGWEINWSHLEKQLADKKTSIFLLCSPHNPSGRVWTQDELLRIADLCEKHHVSLISDEIHMDVTFKKHIPWQGFGMKTKWALVTSASKSFNIPALNGAYAFIPDKKSKEEYLFKLKEVDGLSSPSILAVIAMISAYNKGEPWLNALNEYVAQNQQCVKSYLESAFPCLSYPLPDATYLAWIDLSPLHLDMTQLQKDLIETFQVAIMDGGIYGEEGKGYLRLNLGCPRTKVIKGLEALIEAIKLQSPTKT